MAAGNVLCVSLFVDSQVMDGVPRARITFQGAVIDAQGEAVALGPSQSISVAGIIVITAGMQPADIQAAVLDTVRTGYQVPDLQATVLAI